MFLMGFYVEVVSVMMAESCTVRVCVQVQYLTVMTMELHARTRRDLEPDPEFDPICALFYSFSSDAPLPDSDRTQMTGAIVVDKDCRSREQGEAVKEISSVC